MDQLAALRAFVRIVESGSFVQAASTLRMPKATISKLVQQLEAHLRTKLLSRTTRRLAVTSDGAAYYERALRLLSDLEELDASVTASQAQPSGKLRIDVSSAIAQDIIVPSLGGFFAKYPDIQLDIGPDRRQRRLRDPRRRRQRPVADRPAHRRDAHDHLRVRDLPGRARTAGPPHGDRT